MIGSSTLLSLAVVAFLAAIGALLGARGRETLSRKGVAAAALLPLLSLGLFYSLAIHMHAHFGGWPRVIGQEGFPSGLAMHADLAGLAFSTLLLAGALVWPAAALLCLAVPGWRPGLRYLAFFALACGAAFGAMQLAPDGFLHWWWD